MTDSSASTASSSFLYRIARHYREQYGTDISELCFVFPNRRAGLFFRKYLSEQARQPMFAPETTTVEQLFLTLSPLQLADPTELLFRLYKVYQAYYLQAGGQSEPFDDFVFWGQMMLTDFNDVDRHCADARTLFANIADLKDIEQRFATLPDEQKISLRTFAEGFQEDTQGTLRRKFAHIWKCLYPVYDTFRTQLKADGLAYTGMLQRETIEALQSGQTTLPEKKKYVFAGFNALTATEEALMLFLQAQGCAEFQFDYEAAWLQDPHNKASLFRDRNLSLFPVTAPLPEGTKSTPVLHLIKVPSYTGQAGQVYRLLDRLTKDTTDPQSLTGIGIVLPDEHLLTPLMNAIPEQIGSINVTMGFPLSSTPLFPLLQHLSELQLLQTMRGSECCFHYKPVLSLLHHPYICSKAGETIAALEQTVVQGNMTYIPATLFAGTPLLRHIFRRLTTAEESVQYLSQLMYMLIEDDSTQASDKNEYLRHTLLLLNRLQTLLGQYDDLGMQVPTLYNLLLNLCSNLSVPFEGEPLQGLQIMGVLEARGMDFHTLIITDFNDETFPGSGPQNSYIPYDLRCAFHLPTPEQKDAIAAYNFYRLLSHAKDVYLLQNTLSDERTSGEESRFLHQLRHQYSMHIAEESINYMPRTTPQAPIILQKDNTIMAQTEARLCPPAGKEGNMGLSPSALNTYVECPLRFYLTYIRRLKEADRIQESIRNDKFGTILHSVLERLYAPFASNTGTGTSVTEDDIDAMERRLHNEHLAERAYGEVFLHTDGNEVPTLQGKDYLPVKVIQRYAEAVLEHDKTLARTGTFRYIASELRCHARFATTDGREVYFNGIIDRVDEVDEQIRIVDYKTGIEHSTFPAPDRLFSPDNKKADHVRQTLIYSLLFDATTGSDHLYPHVYYIKNGAEQMDHAIRYSPGKNEEAQAMETYTEMRPAFEQALRQVLDEILNANAPFEARPDNSQRGHCSTCPFASVCGIQV